MSISEPSTELVRVRDAEMDRFARLGMWLAASESDSENPQDRGAAAALRLYMARELGLPLRAAAELNVIKGKLAASVQLQRALAHQAGYRVVKVEGSPESVTAAVIEMASGEELGRATFTMEDAQRAGLVKDGGGYRKHPERMLWARAAGYAMKDVIPEVVLGLVTPDEAAEIDGRVLLEEDLPPAPDVDLVEQAKEAFDATETTPASEPQRRKMHALFRERGADRAQRLAFCSEVAGRDVASATDLTRDEIGKVIDQLEAMPPPRSDESAGAGVAAPSAGAEASEPQPQPPPAEPEPEQLSPLEVRLLALDTLVEQTVEAQAVTVRDLWTEIAAYRRMRPLDLVVELGGQDSRGHWRWLPLREGLQLGEAGDLTRFLEQVRSEAGLPDDIPF